MRNNLRIVEYFTRLDTGNAEATSALFASNALYIRPAMDVTGKLLDGFDRIEGRDEILAFFRERGSRAYRHNTRFSASHGNFEFVEGYIDGGDDAPSTAYVSSAVLNEAGEILRYFATATQLDRKGLAEISFEKGSRGEA